MSLKDVKLLVYHVTIKPKYVLKLAYTHTHPHTDDICVFTHTHVHTHTDDSAEDSHRVTPQLTSPGGGDDDWVHLEGEGTPIKVSRLVLVWGGAL